MDKEFIRVGIPVDNGSCAIASVRNFLDCSGKNRGCPFNLAEILVDNSQPGSLEWAQSNQASSDWGRCNE